MNWRVAFRKHDGADFVRDVPADTGERAIHQVRWLLDSEHPLDHGDYALQMLVRIERKGETCCTHPTTYVSVETTPPPYSSVRCQCCHRRVPSNSETQEEVTGVA